MSRFCYFSRVLPGQSEEIRKHWRCKTDKRPGQQEKEDAYWQHLKMTGFESWLQSTSEGDVMIHCLEGENLHDVFKGLRELMTQGNEIALQLQEFYKQVLGKDYSQPEVEPQIEQLLDISLPPCMIVSPYYSRCFKRGFIYPLLPHKEKEHRQHRQEAMTHKRERHEAAMRAYGVHRLTSWLQDTPQGKYIVIYTEKVGRYFTPEGDRIEVDRLAQGRLSPEWLEISHILADHTGLTMNELNPTIEWFTDNTLRDLSAHLEFPLSTDKFKGPLKLYATESF